jgi:hypothetical protein
VALRRSAIYRGKLPWVGLPQWRAATYVASQRARSGGANKEPFPATKSTKRVRKRQYVLGISSRNTRLQVTVVWNWSCLQGLLIPRKGFSRSSFLVAALTTALKRLKEEGWSSEEIARKMHRTVASVRERWKRQSEGQTAAIVPERRAVVQRR